jgi:DNA-binding transcriptional regulator YhcF (GntR family)
MRFWLSRDTSVPIREQLSAQIILGIASRRFAPGQKLPSVRELARRLKIHANTVSAAYQDLADRGWVARRAGSGVFVSDRVTPGCPETAESFARGCLNDGLARGYSLDRLRDAFQSVWHDSRRHGVVVVDPDFEMARILAAEIAEATGKRAEAIAFNEAAERIPPHAMVFATEAHFAQIGKIMAGRQAQAIRLNSMEDVIAGRQRPDRPILICAASRSASILRWASTLLSALGFAPDSVVLRNASLPAWEEGLRACDIVAVDVVTAAAVSEGTPVVIFRIISESFLREVHDLVTDAEV